MLRLACRAVLISLFALSFSAQADFLGFLDGRAASPGNAGKMSVEVGYTDSDDFSTLGGRFNFQFSPTLTLYADYVTQDTEFLEGTGYGAGIRYHLANQKFLSGMDVSLRASFHTVEYEDTLGIGINNEVESMSAAIHIGSQQPVSGNIKWYGVLSYNTLEADGIEDDSEIGYGGGIYMPFATGQVYLGVEKIDDLIMGVGYRHFLGGS